MPDIHKATDTKTNSKSNAQRHILTKNILINKILKNTYSNAYDTKHTNIKISSEKNMYKERKKNSISQSKKNKKTKHIQKHP